jgi:hypothetical protein
LLPEAAVAPTISSVMLIKEECNQDQERLDLFISGVEPKGRNTRKSKSRA